MATQVVNPLDAYFENEETFKVSLINPTGGATTYLHFPATITIVNDDAPMVGITDGSFELGTPNPVWNEIDSLGSSPICSHATCGPPDFPSQAHRGEYMAWLQIPSAEGIGFLQVSLDDDPIFSVTEADVADYSDYTQVAVDISAYADDGDHHLGFDGSSGSISNYI
ncbi:MAG: hypothetical protein ABFS56_19430 [Pseudomonadota bacterium]